MMPEEMQPMISAVFLLIYMYTYFILIGVFDVWAYEETFLILNVLGTGKTTVIKSVYKELMKNGCKVVLTATTGTGLAAASKDGATIYKFCGVGAGTLSGVQYGQQVLLRPKQRDIIRLVLLATCYLTRSSSDT